jgi:hypothetical protein
VTISRTVTFEEGSLTPENFIDVTQTGKSNSINTGCEMQLSHPRVSETISDEEQVDVEIPANERMTTQQGLTEGNSPVRRSAKSNKGIPAKRLSYMVRTAPQSEPVSWEEMQKLPAHEKQK